jgi:hypothetical protein
MDIAFGLVKARHTAWLYQRTERHRDVPAESRPLVCDAIRSRYGLSA